MKFHCARAVLWRCGNAYAKMNKLNEQELVRRRLSAPETVENLVTLWPSDGLPGVCFYSPVGVVSGLGLCRP
jgi:hypothetical protein